MNKFHFALTVILTVSVLTFPGCSKDSSTQEDSSSMYSEMLSYSNAYAIAVNEHLSGIQTKSGSASFEGFNPAIDFSRIDEKFLKYIDIYTQPENVNNWNEQAILKRVNEDPSFSPEEKEIIVKSIAASFYLKSAFSDVIISTKANAEACEKEFAKAMKRATRNVAIALVAAALEPTPVGETLALVYYYCAIDDAQEDYNDCMAQC